MTEKISGSLLDGVLQFTSLMAAPLARTRAGKSLMGLLPGEVLMASLDAVSKYDRSIHSTD